MRTNYGEFAEISHVANLRFHASPTSEASTDMSIASPKSATRLHLSREPQAGVLRLLGGERRDGVVRESGRVNIAFSKPKTLLLRGRSIRNHELQQIGVANYRMSNRTTGVSITLDSHGSTTQPTIEP